MRSDCIEGEMHQKLFGGRALPGLTGGAHSTPTAQNPPLYLWEGKAMERRAGGKDKGGDERMGRGQKKGEGGKGNERGVVPHPKLNPGCATDSRVK